MLELTKREDQIMQIIWRLEKAIIRDIVAAFPEPRPHYNTVATLVKILVKKKVLHSKMIGNTHQYIPTANFETYREEQIVQVKKKFFDNSMPKMMAHFAKQENMSDKDIAELIKIIKSGRL